MHPPKIVNNDFSESWIALSKVLEGLEMVELPTDYLKFIEQFGEGLIGGYIKIYPINKLIGFTKFWREDNPTKAELIFFKENDRNDCTVIGEILDGDILFYMNSQYYFSTRQFEEKVYPLGASLSDVFNIFKNDPNYGGVDVTKFVPVVQNVNPLFYMGDSVKISCGKCQEQQENKEISRSIINSYNDQLLIGRGLRSKFNSLPGYCDSCQKFVTVKAEDTYCHNCNSMVELCGAFIFKQKNNYSLNGFYYPKSFLHSNPTGLTLEIVVKNSKWTYFQNFIYRISPNKFDLIFKLDFQKKYYCPKCKTVNLKICPGFITWD